MSFDVSIARIALPTDATTLKSFQDDLNLAFRLDAVFSPLLDTTLANVPPTTAKSVVSYTGPAASWNPGGGPVTFGLTGSICGTFEILNSGTLVTWTEGLDSPQQKSIPVGAHQVYTRLTLSFNISANVAGAYSNGPYGVKASLDTEDSYQIVFCKAFAPTTSVREAIAESFTGFVLPLHKNTLAQMANGDYLEHEFDGSVNLSFGAYIGLDQAFYAGQGSADVLSAMGSKLLTLSATVAPTITAGADLGFTLQYRHTFEALLSKQANAATLRLSRSNKKSRRVTLQGGFTLSANASANITSNTPAIQKSIKRVVSGTSPAAADVLNVLLRAGSHEIDKYAGEANATLSSWTARGNGLQPNLQAAIETRDDSTLLAGYTFDLTSAAFPAAWDAAIGGDFVRAFETGAVALDIGCGLERCYQAKTSFNVNFFNLWNFSTWEEFARNTTLVYAGNNIFHLLSRVGRDLETDAVGAMRHINFYFALAGNVRSSGVATDVDLSLHLDLTSKGDRGATSRMATLLHSVKGGPVCDVLANGLHSFAKSKTGTAELHVTIPKAGFSLINCDLYDDKGNRTTKSSDHDAYNWKQFADAASDLDGWPIPGIVSGSWVQYLQGFNAWEALNLTMSDEVNRLVTSYNIGKWPSSFPTDLDENRQRLIIGSLVAGQNFMNFCADLKALAQLTSVTAVGVTWKQVLDKVTKAIKNDSQVDFAAVATLAIVNLCRTGPITVEGPVSSATPTDLFAVTLTL